MCSESLRGRGKMGQREPSLGGSSNTGQKKKTLKKKQKNTFKTDDKYWESTASTRPHQQITETGRETSGNLGATVPMEQQIRARPYRCSL